MPQEKRTGRGALGGLLGFVGLSVAAGVLVTAAVTPALALTGMTANNAISVFDNLPNYLNVDAPMEKSNIYATAADGTHVLLASFFDQNREDVAWENVSQFLKDGAVSAEDPRFYEHGGIDIMGTARAVIKTYVVGGDTQGGSSITQQYVKNVLVQQAEQIADKDKRDAAYKEATKTTPERKLKEMRLAVGVEKNYTKDQILLGYLNIANFGGQSYGVEAASKYYFGVSSKDVNIQQAATLIAMLNNPSGLRIDRPDQEVNGAADGYSLTKIRRDYVINKMLDEKKITQEEHDAALASAVEPNIVQPSSGCQTAGNAAYFCDYVTWVIKRNPAFGATDEERLALLKRGGLDVYTTLDLDLQNSSQAAIDAYIPKAMARVDIGATAATVQPGTGRVLAMAQNKNYTAGDSPDPSFTAVNYNTDQAYGGSTGFPVGSSYKVYTLLDWLKNGHSLNETVDGKRRTFTSFTNTCEGNWRGAWNPQNFDGSSPGAITAIDATKRSVNSAFVAMAQKLDLCEIRQTAESMGVHRADGKQLVDFPGSILGSNDIAGLTMAASFAGIAAQGKYCEPIVIDEIVKPDGEKFVPPNANCKQGVTPEIANTAAYAMQTIFQPGGTAAATTVRGAPLFGKTGTADDALHSWITGGTTKAVTSLWIGNVSGKASMYNVRVLGGQTGFSAKFKVWSQIMNSAVGKFGGDAFPQPSQSLIRAKQVAVPDVRGKSVADATTTLQSAGFTVATGEPIASQLQEGVVAATEPGAGANVSVGSTITLRPSSGQPAEVAVPDVANQNQQRAQKSLEDAGFGVQFMCTADPNAPNDGQVTGQNPAANTNANPENTTVTVALKKKNCG